MKTQKDYCACAPDPLLLSAGLFLVRSQQLAVTVTTSIACCCHFPEACPSAGLRFAHAVDIAYECTCFVTVGEVETPLRPCPARPH